MTSGRESSSQVIVRGVGVWVQERPPGRLGLRVGVLVVGGLEGERGGGGRGFGWERVETIVGGDGWVIVGGYRRCGFGARGGGGELGFLRARLLRMEKGDERLGKPFGRERVQGRANII